MPRGLTSPAPLPELAVDPTTLTGEWQLERRIADHRTGEMGQMVGSLSLTLDPSGLWWAERGTLRWAGRDIPAQRLLAVRLLNGEWWMTFADGSPFHTWQPGRLVHHPCQADRYAGLVDVHPSGDLMRILWDIEGPAKRQRIFTRYRRQTPGAATI